MVTAAQGGLKTVLKFYVLLLENIMRGLCTQNIYHSLRSTSPAREMFSKVPRVGRLCCGL